MSTEQTKHTSGLWLMNCTNKFMERIPNMLCITDENDRLIAGVSHDLTEVSIDEYTANSELIASAPKLLQENKELKEQRDELLNTMEKIKTMTTNVGIKFIINKAIGK